MSLCNTFRLFVVSLIIVLSSIDTPVVSFTLRRTTIRENHNHDLAQEESVIREDKIEFTEKTNFDGALDTTQKSIENEENIVQTTSKLDSDSNYTTENYKNTDLYDQNMFNSNKSVDNISTQYEKDIESTTVDSKTTNLQTTTDYSALKAEITTQAAFAFNETNTEMNNPSEFEITDASTWNNVNISRASSETIESYRSTDIIVTTPKERNTINHANKTTTKGQQFRKNVKLSTTMRTMRAPDKFKQMIMKQENPETTTSQKLGAIPKWKKYTTIERKRTKFVSNEKIDSNPKKENMINAETKQTRISLQDTVTSDIPSLEQLKKDLLSSPFKLQTIESNRGVIASPPTIGENAFDEHSVKLITSTSPATVEDKRDIIQSQRGGFLNYSGKTLPAETTSEGETHGFKSNDKESLQTVYETESPETEILGDKPGNKVEFQSVLNEDAIKEELLKEELISDHKANVQRQRDDGNNNSDSPTETYTLNSDNNLQLNSTSDDNLSVKPIPTDKTKNVTIYAVNPNYKPMKKIEVLPPKPFVRDPDDNSWRNESLSSLGIVFKPKNSSKPFTQVLKNKTEAEWNSLSEKDSKNDIPDLRERLQKMTEKRKSKRKKLDSFGNIVYFDYEENSNSAENSSIPAEDHPLSTTSTPLLLSPEKLSSTSTESPQGVTNITTSTTVYTINTPTATKKIKKIFNVPEYYDSTDEDDIEYLNMAKIDLKKFTTSQKTTTPLHIPTIASTTPQWPKINNKLTSKFPFERKATIQHFPPLTTQKVNINDYDHVFKYKVESFTTETEKPQNVLPVSVNVPTTPINVNAIEYNIPHKDFANNFENTRKTEITKDLILTQPILTTQTAFTMINNDGNFDSGSFVIKNYKDFVNEAAKDSEFDRNVDYLPFTESPIQGVTKNVMIDEVETEKTKINIDDAYDYETQFRKDVLQRFVDNFNQNSERYKSGFPLLFNNSIIHREMQNGRDSASSRAIMRGLYSSDIFRPKIMPQKKLCEPNCEKVTVELSPAYELHYYVPEQEEREEAAPQPVTLQYQYRL